MSGTDPSTRLGYSFREFSILKLPLFGYSDNGPVLFLDTANGPEQVPVRLADRYLSMLPDDYGPLTRGAYFPF